MLCDTSRLPCTYKCKNCKSTSTNPKHSRHKKPSKKVHTSNALLLTILTIVPCMQQRTSRQQTQWSSVKTSKGWWISPIQNGLLTGPITKCSRYGGLIFVPHGRCGSSGGGLFAFLSGFRDSHCASFLVECECFSTRYKNSLYGILSWSGIFMYFYRTNQLPTSVKWIFLSGSAWRFRFRNRSNADNDANESINLSHLASLPSSHYLFGVETY